MKNVNNQKSDSLSRAEIASRDFDPTMWINTMADINGWSLSETLTYHNELISRAISTY
jgi:hypothetical protein